MTKQEAKNISIGDTVWRVDSWGNLWRVEVVAGNKACLAPDKTVGIEWTKDHFLGFARTQGEAEELLRKVRDEGVDSIDW